MEDDDMAMTQTFEQGHVPVLRTELPWALGRGAALGVVAGLVFAAFEMVASAAMMGMQAFFMPLRMIGAMVLGPEALDPSYSLVTAGAAGLVVHLVLSIIYGMAFAVIAGGLKARTWDITLGAAFGFALWLFNFYVVAPRAFPWFLDSSPVVQFIAHTFFFGAVLGYLMWRAAVKHNAQDMAAGVR
jgi:uncharacterized membrane protein YagU involved in acid resistance